MFVVDFFLFLCPIIFQCEQAWGRSISFCVTFIRTQRIRPSYYHTWLGRLCQVALVTSLIISCVAWLVWQMCTDGSIRLATPARWWCLKWITDVSQLTQAGHAWEYIRCVTPGYSEPCKVSEHIFVRCEGINGTTAESQRTSLPN